jgi:hypothetical protein
MLNSVTPLGQTRLSDHFYAPVPTSPTVRMVNWYRASLNLDGGRLQTLLETDGDLLMTYLRSGVSLTDFEATVLAELEVYMKTLKALLSGETGDARDHLFVLGQVVDRLCELLRIPGVPLYYTLRARYMAAEVARTEGQPVIADPEAMTAVTRQIEMEKLEGERRRQAIRTTLEEEKLAAEQARRRSEADLAEEKRKVLVAEREAAEAERRASEGAIDMAEQAHVREPVFGSVNALSSLGMAAGLGIGGIGQFRRPRTATALLSQPGVQATVPLSRRPGGTRLGRR